MNYIPLLDKRIRSKFSKDACHDIFHLYRVLNLALHISEKEGGDKQVIVASAFLHDLHRMMQSESGRFHHPRESLALARKLLAAVDFPKDKIPAVLYTIEHHEEYNFSRKAKKITDINTLIVQDADNLDAMGAIGIGRTFAFSAMLGVPMWDPSKPFRRKYFSEDKKDVSTLHHFHSKLLKLKGSMNTKTARAMAKGRHEYMIGFVERFKQEWKGKI